MAEKPETEIETLKRLFSILSFILSIIVHTQMNEREKKKRVKYGVFA